MRPITYFKTLLFHLKEERKVRYHLYRNPSFKAADQALLKTYRGKNPYRISIQYLKSIGANDIYTYGETPLSTMAKIAHHFSIVSTDRVIEMGAGRGRAALFLSSYLGCNVRAYEWIPEFVTRFKRCGFDAVEMLREDMFKADLTWATVIFLYGSMLSDQEILSLTETFPIGVKIITVSYSLSEYSEDFQTLSCISGQFPWGETEVYLNERTC